MMPAANDNAMITDAPVQSTDDQEQAPSRSGHQILLDANRQGFGYQLPTGNIRFGSVTAVRPPSRHSSS